MLRTLTWSPLHDSKDFAASCHPHHDRTRNLCTPRERVFNRTVCIRSPEPLLLKAGRERLQIRLLILRSLLRNGLPS